MNKQAVTTPTVAGRLRGGFAVIFVLLGIALSGFTTGYWLWVIEPLILDDAASRARALAQAQCLALERALSAPCSQTDTITDLESALSTMLLLKEPSTDTPFLRRISLKFDYDVVPAAPGRLDLAVGAADCDACFVAEVPLYNVHSRQLIGVATFHSTPEFLRRLIGNVRLKLVGIGLTSLVLIGLAGLGTRHLLQRLKALEEELRLAALTDPLTGLANRRALLARLDIEIERVQRYPEEHLSIMLIDLDYFKLVNDTFGHAVGDQVLVTVANTLLRVVRATDLVGRYGGEEFLVILPHTSWQEAMDVAERVRLEVRDLQWTEPNLRVSVSGGIHVYQGETSQVLIAAADDKLYRAKKAGRDRMQG